MGNIIVFEIDFNTSGLKPNRLTRQWFKERIGIFRRFTLKSLEAQTNQQFLAVVKLARDWSDMVEEEMAQHPPLPANIRFGTNLESNRSIASWVREVRQARQNPYKGQERNLFITRIGFDDLYHKSFVQQLHDYIPLPGTVALVNQKGYLWDTVHGQMAPLFYSSPQFYVILYSASAYLSGVRIMIPGNGHRNVMKLPHEVLKDRNYVDVIHALSVTAPTVPLVDRLSTTEMEHVLAEFI
ncbi:hypothetical protein GC101_11465 [Paenibacillus sp. LMG 31459]|uniref:Uncharacterized protein n=1 Tax=Paenibacillus phytohabitans TaxID=2654978 RepID=A0ABX1YFC6_9BACL|nr:glycosyltransferase [Paenibacillus phytohabitans]NOU79496.1 hypothetical protein [Paenibacillus phytohabitans]